MGTLFDEVEFGLEPHRITRLIKHVREDKRGQYFLTTHSPTVLRELTVKELYVVHSKGGVVQITSAAKDGLEQLEVQGKIRSSTEAFLAKKVVVCEGATEVGFVRGFDDHQVGKGKDPLSYHGVALLDARGASKIKDLAKAFKSLGYDVSVLADADAEDQFSTADVAELMEHGVLVHVWDDKYSLEAGYGKTHLIAMAVKVANKKQLILTHTFAGVNSIRAKMTDFGVPSSKYQIDTIASWSLRLCLAYPKSSGWRVEHPTGKQWNLCIRLTWSH